MVIGLSPVAGHTEMALFAFAPRGVVTRIQPQFPNLYHFHVADPVDPSISVYSLVFCAQPYLCSKSSLNLKKKKDLPFLLSHLGPFLSVNTFSQNSGPGGSLAFGKKKKKKLYFLEQFEIHRKIEQKVEFPCSYCPMQDSLFHNTVQLLQSTNLYWHIIMTQSL